MLVIRPEQLAVFQASLDHTFVRSLLPHLRARAGAAVPADDAAAERQAADALQRARRHGVRDSAALTSFIALAFQLGPRFDEHPHVRRALAAGASADVVFSTLPNRLRREEWEEVHNARE